MPIRTLEVHTRVTPEMREQLEELARANDRSLAGEMNRALRLYLVSQHGIVQDYREVDRG